MGLTLYRTVGSSNRVALGALAADVEYFTAAKDDTGVITLTPVNIVGSTAATEMVDVAGGVYPPADNPPFIDPNE
jgi:hypothetical protein